MSVRYKHYGKLPKEFYGVRGSFFNKPRGGLWGCRGEEWREWCLAEEYEVDRLKKFFLPVHHQLPEFTQTHVHRVIKEVLS